MCLKRRDVSISFLSGTKMSSDFEPRAKISARGDLLGKAQSVAAKSSRFKLGQVFIERACATLGLWGPPVGVLSSFRMQLREQLLVDDVLFTERAKKIVCWFRAKYLGNALPDIEYVPSGAFGKWAKPRLMGFGVKNSYLWNSVFNFKNLSLPVTKPVVKANLQKHWIDVQKVDTASEQDCIEAVDSIGELLDEVAVKVGRAYDKLRDNLFSDAIGGTPASNKASYSSTSAVGGEVGELYRMVFWTPSQRTRIPWGNDEHSWTPGVFEKRLEMCDERMVGPLAPFSKVGRTLLLKRLKYDVSSQFDRKVLGWVANFECRLDGENVLDWTASPRLDVANSKHLLKCLLLEVTDDTFGEYWHENLLTLVDTESPVEVRVFSQHGDYVEDIVTETFPESRSYFEHWLSYYLDEALEREDLPKCRVVAVCEPLKVRVITVSDAITNFFSTWYQKTVHHILCQFEAFELLGTAPRADLIDRVWRNSFGTGALSFDSSDFSGASNGTPAKFRDLLLDRCTVRLPWKQRRLQQICNGAHIIEYPAWTGLEPVVQNRGTLMGRKTSFPILSLQVFATHVWALRLAGDRRSLRALMKGVRVNGDDRVTRYDTETFDIFWNCCKRLQFGASLGKSYFHPTYANINSQSYHCSARGYRKVGSLYCGLLHGQKKLATDVFDPTSVVTALVESCLTDKMGRAVLAMFLKLHKHSLLAHTCDRNLFVAEVLGGCGQKAPIGWKWSLTADQQRLATYLWEKDLFLWDARVPHGKHLEVLAPDREAWDVEGKRTYWDQIRTLQDGRGEDAVPLSAVEKACHKLWLKDEQLPVVRLLKRKFVRNASIRRMPLKRVEAPDEVPWFGLWGCNGALELGNEFRPIFPLPTSLKKELTFLQVVVLRVNLVPRWTEWITSVHDEESRRVVIPLTGEGFRERLFRIGG